MSILPNQTPIEYNKTEEADKIIHNIIKMLYTRGIIVDNNKDETSKQIDNATKKILDNKNDDNQYKIETTDGQYLIKLLPQKITTKSKSSNIYEFLTENKDIHTIIIVSQITTKLVMELISEFPNAEIFKESDLKTDKASYCFQPKFILLSQEEEKQYLDAYQIKKNEMAKMNFYDPMARYFNTKSGQIFKIIRASPISSISEITYRVVK